MSTYSYIYGKALKTKVDKFENTTLQVLVLKNYRYPANIYEMKNNKYTNIKTRHTMNVEEGKIYRFMVMETDSYKNHEYVKRFQIEELPKEVAEKLMEENDKPPAKVQVAFD